MASVSLERVWLDGEELDLVSARLDHDAHGKALWSVEVQLNRLPTVDVQNLDKAAFKARAATGEELSGEVVMGSGPDMFRFRLQGTGPLAGVE